MLEDISILYAEDEAGIRKRILSSLQRRIPTIYVAENGVQALKLYQDNKPDIILTDIKMPEMDGLQLAENILKIDPLARIIVITAFSDLDFLTKAIDIGISSYILKPMDTTKLFQAIEKSAESLYLNKQKLALENALQKSQDNINLISSLVSEFYFSFSIDDKENVLVDWLGGAFKQITGVEPENCFSLTDLFAIISENDKYKAKKHIRKLMGNERGFLEFHIINKRQKKRLLRMKSYPQWSEKHKRVTRIYGTAEDITKQRDMEHRLSEYEARYEILFRNTPMGAVLSELNGNIIDVNDAFLNMTGYSHSEVLQKTTEIFYHNKNDRERLLDRLMNNEYVNYVRNFYTSFKHKSGRIIDTELTVSLVRVQDLNILLTLVQDITKRKKTENELMQLTQQLTQADALKGLLLDIISHDMRNQTGNIQMISDILNEQYPQDEKIALLKKSSSAMVKTLAKASSISQLALYETLTREKINLKTVISETIAAYNYQIQKFQIQIDNKVSNDLWVKANPLLYEVLHNYLNNAIEHSKKGKKIIVEANAQDQDTQNTVRIIDFGETIPKYLREDIFTRTMQSTEKSRIGHGLGLAIVSQIARAHKGKAWVEPNSPTGNIFCFSWPEE